MYSRSKKLLDLALKDEVAEFVEQSPLEDQLFMEEETVTAEGSDNGTSHLRKITVIQEKIGVLDDKTGRFVFTDRNYLHKNEVLQEQTSGSTNFILDENTGQLILQDSLESDSHLSESDYSCSESNYSPSEYSSDTDDSLSLNSGPSRILNEFSGIVKMKRARKGMGNKENWARNRLKLKRMKGQEYVSIKRQKNEGTVGVERRQKRALQERCDSEKCSIKFSKKCNKITNIDRKTIFDSFWKLNWEQRKAYVVAMATIKPVGINTTGGPSRRTNTINYALKVGGEIIPVCKRMFCHTLCLGEWTVTNWIKGTKTNDIGMTTKPKSVKRRKAINVTKVDHIKTFLNSLPKMPSHYCRQNSSRQYVDVNFTTWAQVYIEFEKYLRDNNISENEKPTYKCFLDVINKSNLSIYRPKKDQCDICFAYKNKNLSEEDYQNHVKARDRARKEKQDDKSRCLSGEIHMLTVDLQAVQSIPMISAGAQYFKLKLSVHQFTIFNEFDKSVACYVWHEGEGGMESNVFTSCLINYLEHLEDKTKPIIIYSDGCNAQNRNTTLSNALQQFAITYNAEVQQKYLVVSHTQMECDSVHATIERKKKGKELYVPADFVTVINQARICTTPYQVKYLTHTFFNDYSYLKYIKSIRPGFKKGDECVVDIKALKYTSQPGVLYKLGFDDDWSLLPHRVIRQGTSHITIPKLYTQPLPISKRKYDDLQDMKQLIPADYHSFYDNLSHD